MDHLPLARGVPRKHIIVPYYDCSDFGYDFTPPLASWPKRHDYYPGSELFYRELRVDSYPDRLKPQLAAFAQSWLWFGLLCEFLEIPCRVDDWIVQHNFETQREAHGYRISTQDLLPKLNSWYVQTRRSSDDQRAKILERVDGLFDCTNSGLFAFAFSMCKFDSPVEDLPEPLVLSLAVLTSTLVHVRNAAFPQEPELQGFSGQYESLMNLMKLDGWCPTQIHRLYVDGDIIARYVASRVGPVSSLDHSQCEEYRCSASQVKHETYQTKHVSPDCSCSMLRNLSSEAVDILLQGRVPLVRFRSDLNTVEVKGVELSVSNDIEFIAISHVWSDGLGNLNQNSIPLCQLRKIQKQVDFAMPAGGTNTTSGVWFWMDTLCIPVGIGLQTARTAAIAKMVHVYRRSKLTLILNAELAQISSDLEPWELSIRINRAAWFNRLWTLHEGVVSQRSVFQLKDFAVTMEEITERTSHYEDHVGRIIETYIQLHFSRPYNAMIKFKNLPVHERVREIWSAVQWRNTSNRDDETICLANMLELDLSPILAVDRSDPEVCRKRMKAFILQQENFPQDSPFRSIEQAERDALLVDPGYRWAPESFVFRSGNYDKAVSPLGKADSQGLHVKMPALLPRTEWAPFLRLATIDLMEDHERKRIDERLKGDVLKIAFMIPHQWDYHYVLHWSKSHVPHFDKELLKSTQPAILLETDLPNEKLNTAEQFGVGRHVEGFAFDEGPASSDEDYDVEEEGQGENDEIDGDLSHPEVPLSFFHRGLLVAILEKESQPTPFESHDASMNRQQNFCRVTPFAFVLVRKSMFSTSRRKAIYQLGDAVWPFKKHPKNKIGWFEAVPEDTSWCIG